MKTTIPSPISLRHRACLFTVCLLSICPPVTATDPPQRMHRPEFMEKMKHWQQRMSENYRDHWKDVRESANARLTISTASVDLREQNDGYTVRVSLPKRDLAKARVVLENGGHLRIIAPAEGALSRYEQLITLAKVAPGAQPEVERMAQNHMLLIRVPKSGETPKPEPSSLPPPSTKPPTDGWDRDVLDQMRGMRREMDRIFEKAFDEFRTLPDYGDLFDLPHFGSSIDLQEIDGKYVITVYLPDRKMADAEVTIDGQTLKVHAREKTAKTVDGAEIAQESAYSQILTLPGPVLADQLKVERKEGMLVVTVPKQSGG
jgi:HSP20 family molecular chaperone IbpA